jgi:fructose-1,6-bisphosphatase/inositol monophosphatase family enzyme
LRLHLEDQRNGARAEWLPIVDELITKNIVYEDDGLKWTPIASLFTRVFAKKARSRRDLFARKTPYKPLVWNVHRGWFVRAAPHDLTRQEEEGGFWPLDLCEKYLHLEKVDPGRGRALLEDCVETVKCLFRGSRPPSSDVLDQSHELLAVVGGALRVGAAVADEECVKMWGRGGGSKEEVCEIEKKIERAMSRVVANGLRGGAVARHRAVPALSWISRGVSVDGDKAPKGAPESSQRIFIVEALGGQRNAQARLPFYSVSIGVARRDGENQSRLRPVCAGVYVPSVSHLYVGLCGPNGGGAALIDERLFEVRKLAGTQDWAPGTVTVGIHHSRAEKVRSRVFINGVSAILPEEVNKTLALGAGAWSLALVAAGSLAAYFEVSISYYSAYAGAVILCAAVGSPSAATDLAGDAWLNGNPIALNRKGILAWSTRRAGMDTGDLRSALEDRVRAICRDLPD